MSTPPPMRPRFEKIVALPPAQVLGQLRKAMDRSDAVCCGTTMPGHAVLRLPDDQQHFWSPRLSLEVEAHPDGAILRGLFGPKPNVWTLFMGMYLAIGFSGTTGLMFGLSQWSLGMSPLLLWSVPAALLVGAAVYGLALYGQRLSREHRYVLRQFVDEAVD